MRALAVGLGASLMAIACTGGGGHTPVPPTTTAVTFLPSADRIRLGKIRVGGPAACIDDEFCAAGLARVYGIDVGGVVAQPDPMATVGLLDAGAIDVGVLPRYAAHTAGAVALTDDRHLAPQRAVVPVIAPGLAPFATGIDAVTAHLDPSSIDEVEQGLAAGRSPDDVASAWLQARNLLAPSRPPLAPAIGLGVRSTPETTAWADIYAGALASAGVGVQVIPIDGGEPAVFDALAAGHITMTVDTVDRLVEDLTGFADPHPSAATLRTLLADRHLTATSPAPGGPGHVWTVSPAVAHTLGVTSLSDLARANGAHLAPPTTTAPATTTALPTAGASLGIGDQGPGVLALQQLLVTLGYPALRTGVYDEPTRRAVVGFQLDQGVIATGEDDPTTQRALASAHPTTHPSAPPVPGDGSVRPDTSTHTLYLVFGDGPASATPALVQALNRRGATATFLLDDAAIGHHPDIARNLVAGEAVGITEPPHDTTSAIGEDALLRTADRTRDDLAAATGHTPACFLVPYGSTDATRTDIAGHGLKPVVWDVDPQDWRRPRPAAVAADVIDNVHDGSIVLLHDGGGDRSATTAALPTILDTLQGRGYRFAALPGC